MDELGHVINTMWPSWSCDQLDRIAWQTTTSACGRLIMPSNDLWPTSLMRTVFARVKIICNSRENSSRDACARVDADLEIVRAVRESWERRTPGSWFPSAGRARMKCPSLVGRRPGNLQNKRLQMKVRNSFWEDWAKPIINCVIEYRVRSKDDLLRSNMIKS